MSCDGKVGCAGSAEVDAGGEPMERGTAVVEASKNREMGRHEQRTDRAKWQELILWLPLICRAELTNGRPHMNGPCPRGKGQMSSDCTSEIGGS